MDPTRSSTIRAHEIHAVIHSFHTGRPWLSGYMTALLHPDHSKAIC